MEVKLILLTVTFVVICSNNDHAAIRIRKKRYVIKVKTTVNVVRPSTFTPSTFTHNIVTPNITSSNFTTPKVSTFCHTIRNKGNKSHIYCDITSSWLPKYSKSDCIAAIVIISSFTMVTTLIGVICMVKISIGALLISKLIWSAIDVTLDVYTFYQLNNGKLVDPVIQREVPVLNGILAFAVLGAVAMLINIGILLVAIEGHGIEQERMILPKMGIALMTFVFEDCF